MEKIASGPSQLTNLAQPYHMKVPASHSLVVDHARSRVSDDKQRFRGLWTGHHGACMLTSLTAIHAGADKTSVENILFKHITKNKIPLVVKGSGGDYPKDSVTRSFSTDFSLLSETSCALVKRIFWRSLILLGICILGYFTRSKCFC